MTAWQIYVFAYMLAFALGPLFLRTLLLWRATGRNPLLLESFQTAYGFVQRLVTVCLAGYGVTMGLYAFAPGLYARLPAFESLHHDWARWAGVVLTLGALVVMWLAQSAMGRS